MSAAASGHGGGGGAPTKKSFDKQFKVLLLGDSGVGKTNLLTRYINDEFCKTFVTTIGIDYKVHTLNVDDYKVKLHLWDTAGQERFRTITSSYYRGANAVLLVFDVTSRDSFEKIEVWARQIQEHNAKPITMVIVGNKCDVPSRVVTEKEGEELAKSLGAEYVSTSAKENINVDKAFRSLAERTLRAAVESEKTDTQQSSNSGFKIGSESKDSKKSSGKCC